MKKKPIKIHVISAMTAPARPPVDDDDEGDDDFSVDMTTDATICDEGGKIVIEYDEILSEEQSVTHTVLSFEKEKPQTVFLTRSGDVSMTCVLEENKRYRFMYNVGPASLDFVAVGHGVTNSIGTESGEIRLLYDMEIRGMLVNSCDFKMTII